jgi:hypothetical protein
MARFILIDPSLTGVAGHHYEYAVHVLDAAREAGFAPILVANRNLQIDAALPWETYATFKYGFWGSVGGQPPAGRIRRTLADWKQHARRLARNILVAPQMDHVPGSTWLRAAARSGLEAQRRLAFVADTEHLLDQLKLTPEDHVFVPTVSALELAGLQECFCRRPAATAASWHLLFRRNLPRKQSAARTAIQQALFAFQTQSPGRRMRFYTDSDELTAQYDSLKVVSFETLPIPDTDPAPPQSEGVNSPWRIIYVGDARQEKGFQHLPAVVEQLTQIPELQGRLQFIFHASRCTGHVEPEVEAARQRLESWPIPCVTLINSALPSADYHRFLSSGHITLLPYDRGSYDARTSGVFVASLAAGVPAVVPAGTWMARQVRSEHERWIDECLKDSRTIRSESPIDAPVMLRGAEKQLLNLAVPKDATHLLVRCTVDRMQAGWSTAITLSLAAKKKPTCATATEIIESAGAGKDGARRIVPLPRNCDAVQLSLRCQHAEDVAIVSRLEVEFLARPESSNPTAVSAVSRTFAHVSEIAACVQEMLTNYPHYRQSAAEFAVGWREKHNANRLLAMLTKDAASATDSWRKDPAATSRGPESQLPHPHVSFGLPTDASTLNLSRSTD